MERLYEQMRIKYRNSEKKYREPSDTTEGQMPTKKTVSFKEEKKGNWFQRQLSGQMSQVDEPSDNDFATAIAAATYAINSLEEHSPDRQMPVDGLQTSLTKTKGSIPKTTDSGRISRWFSGKEAQEDRVSVGSKRFTDEQGKINEQNASAMVKSPTLRMGSGKLNLTSSGHTDTKADAWEKAELGKIQKRYEKTHSSIVEWEGKKKTEAKLRLERNEMEIQRRRTRALQEYNDEIARIDKIASGARAVTDEKNKKDVSKIKKKANEIRSTGSVPRACFFF